MRLRLETSLREPDGRWRLAAEEVQQDKGILFGGRFKDSVLERRGERYAEALRFQPPYKLAGSASPLAHHEHRRRGTTRTCQHFSLPHL